MPAPTIVSVTPPTGITTGGTVILINGTNFIPAATAVTFDGIAATNISVIDASNLYCETPADVAGAVDVMVTTAAGSDTALGAFTYTAPQSTAYKLTLWDDCCHLFLSTNSGGNFTQGATPGGPATPAPDDPGQDPYGVGTLQDFWVDGAMAVNDGDYNTFVGIDENYDKVAGRGFGILAISLNNGVNLSYTLIDPEPNSPAFIPDHTFEQNYFRGAISANAQTILLATDRTKGVPNAYPRISYDAGVTWADVTGVPNAIQWAGAALASTASQIMYLSSFAGPVRKSIDWGVTWSILAGGPPNSTLMGRLRCNPTGQTVIQVDDSGDFWGSRDGGTTWNHIDFAGLVTIGNGPSDCGVSSDGQTVVVGFTQDKGLNLVRMPAIFVSTDGGLTFSDVTANLQFPASAGPPLGGAPITQDVGFSSCNVAPDGLGIVVTFIWQDTGIIQPDGVQGFVSYVNVSYDAGASFTLCSFNQDPYETNSDTARFSATYITPAALASTFVSLNAIVRKFPPVGLPPRFGVFGPLQRG